jgi:RNA polymerase sigma-70 factor
VSPALPKTRILAQQVGVQSYSYILFPIFFGLGMRSHSNSSVSAAIVQAYHHGCAVHGALELQLEHFKSHVIWVVERNLEPDASSQAAINFIGALHTSDLYLGLACARQTEAAWDRFNTLYRKYIDDLATSVTPTKNAAADLADNVLADLFLPDHSGQSRIASYQGRSSLATWLRVIISHRATNERKRLSNNTESLESIQDIADETALNKMAVSLRACRYGRVIGESLRYSCQCLTDRERLILLLRYDNCLQLGQIGRLLGVHQSTITRQIEGACKKLREAVIANLLTKHKLDRAAIDECAADILDNPSYSILSLIEPKPPLR